MATYGEARAQRWRCVARRARELIWTRWGAVPAERRYRRLLSGGHMRGARQNQAVRGMQSGVPADADGMPVRLHHIVMDAHDLPGLARFWAQAPGWKVGA